MKIADVVGRLRKRPHTTLELVRMTPGQRVVRELRRWNDVAEEQRVVYCAPGLNKDGLRTMVYWVRPIRLGKAWRRRFAAAGVNPEEGEVL